MAIGCQRCNNRILPNEAVAVSGETWCTTCAAAHAEVCSKCGALVADAQGALEVNEHSGVVKIYCPACLLKASSAASDDDDDAGEPANSNCLDGMRCPSCEAREPFRIATTCMAEVHDDGIGDTTDHEWSDDSLCLCLSCDHRGTVKDFKIENQTPKEKT